MSRRTTIRIDQETANGESYIEWTEHFWSPVTGCTKQSPGCKHCYAETMARRRKAMGTAATRTIRAHDPPDRLDQALRRRAPTVYFVNSMSDLFHENVPDAFIEKVIAVWRQEGIGRRFRVVPCEGVWQYAWP